MFRGDSPTILQLQKVLYQILHEPVLLRHVALEDDHLAEHALIVAFEVPNVPCHLIVGDEQAVDGGLQPVDGGQRLLGCGGEEPERPPFGMEAEDAVPLRLALMGSAEEEEEEAVRVYAERGLYA